MSETTLYHGDCLVEMNKIADKSVDMILCDLPYGQLKSDSLTWDIIIPFDKMWKQYNRIIKDNGVIALFGSGLFTVDLINSNRKDFKYNLIWEKNVPIGMSSAKYRPMKYYETISIFYKSLPTYNPIMKERVGEGKECYKYEHYCGDSNHLKLDKIKKKYDPNFVQPSDILKFNVVPNRNGKLHPTQKPTDLLEYLIKTYTNENDFCYYDPPYANTKGMYYGAIDNDAFFNFLSDLKCPYCFSFDGYCLDEDSTYDVPKSIYDEHVYLKSGNSSFRRVIGNDTKQMVYESLYVKGCEKNKENIFDL